MMCGDNLYIIPDSLSWPHGRHLMNEAEAAAVISYNITFNEFRGQEITVRVFLN